MGIFLVLSTASPQYSRQVGQRLPITVSPSGDTGTQCPPTVLPQLSSSVAMETVTEVVTGVSLPSATRPFRVDSCRQTRKSGACPLPNHLTVTDRNTVHPPPLLPGQI